MVLVAALNVKLALITSSGTSVDRRSRYLFYSAEALHNPTCSTPATHLSIDTSAGVERLPELLQ
jgi:hypothetical protein